MKITKRNGTISVYDDKKIVSSILRANVESEEKLSEKTAARIANEVFARLTAEKEIITTAEIRSCVLSVLREKGFAQTADQYEAYKVVNPQ